MKGEKIRERKKSRSRLKLFPRFRMYFWDVDWDDLLADPERYKAFIVRRLADKGDQHVFAWLKRHFDLIEIGEIVLSSRSVSAKTQEFWRNYVEYLRGSRTSPG